MTVYDSSVNDKTQQGRLVRSASDNLESPLQAVISPMSARSGLLELPRSSAMLCARPLLRFGPVEVAGPKPAAGPSIGHAHVLGKVVQRERWVRVWRREEPTWPRSC